MISPGRAYDRYCAVAHTRGRSVVASSAPMAAPRAQPPKRNCPSVEIPSVMGSTHRIGLWVGWSPSQVVASTGPEPTVAATGPRPPGEGLSHPICWMRCMARQLSLLEAPPTWPLSQATRETGRRGVAEARKALAEAVARAKQAQEAEEA